MGCRSWVQNWPMFCHHNSYVVYTIVSYITAVYRESIVVGIMTTLGCQLTFITNHPTCLLQLKDNQGSPQKTPDSMEIFHIQCDDRSDTFQTESSPPQGCCASNTERVLGWFHRLVTRHGTEIRIALILLASVAYAAYFGYCISRGIHSEDDIRLIWLTAVVAFGVLYSTASTYFNDPLGRYVFSPLRVLVNKHWLFFKW